MPEELEKILQELRSTMGKMEMGLDSIHEPIVWLDSGGMIQWCNKPFTKLVSIQKIRVLGQSIFTVFPLQKSDHPLANDIHPVQIIHDTCEAFHGVYTFHGVEGKLLLEITGNCLTLEKDISSFILVIRDISEQIIKEEIKLQSKALAAAVNAIVITDKQGKIQWINSSFTELTGYYLEEIHNQDMRILKSGKQSNKFYENLWQTISAGRIWEGELLNRKKDGSLYTEEQTITPVFDDNGAITHFIAIKQDISARKKTQQKLAESENITRNIINKAISGIITIDEKGIIESFNPAAEEMFGYSAAEVIGQNVKILQPEPYRSKHDQYLQNYVETGRAKIIGIGREVVAQRRNGEIFPMELAISEMLANDRRIFMGLTTDITDRKQAEDELNRAQKKLEDININLEKIIEERTAKLQETQSHMVMQEKMATVGQLAAGMAHEINNPINFVKTNFDTLKMNVNDLRELFLEYKDLAMNQEITPEVKSKTRQLSEKEQHIHLEFMLEDLDNLFSESEEGFNRVTGIINSMRDFSRIDHLDEHSFFNINTGIENTLLISKNEYKYHADIELELGDVPEILCTPQQINQVFMNIVVNAAQAITAQEKENRGTISIRTSADEKSVYCEISDDGPGIPEDKINRVFEPFFTTKEVGKGTGLGLSISYDIIVNKHGGSLSVISPGNGTTFKISLPIKKT